MRSDGSVRKALVIKNDERIQTDELQNYRRCHSWKIQVIGTETLDALLIKGSDDL